MTGKPFCRTHESMASRLSGRLPFPFVAVLLVVPSIFHSQSYTYELHQSIDRLLHSQDMAVVSVYHMH
jgi:hypothetical protein